MKKQTELISVILPIYNAEKFLPHCLDSLLAQTHKNLEIIAVDDFSKDQSFQILYNYLQKDSRIRAFRNVKRYGTATSLNRALKQASGKFIVFMKPEDIAHRQKLSEQLSYLLKHEKIVAIGTQCIYVDEKEKKAGKSAFPEDFIKIYKKPLNGTSLLFETLMINKYRIPKDLLYFKTNRNPFLYADVLISLMKYGEILNLPHYLHFHRTLETRKPPTSTKHLPFLIKLWVRSLSLHEFNPVIKSLLFPTVKSPVS